MLKGKLFIELLCFFGRAKKKLAGTLVFLFALEFFHGIEMLKGEIFSFCFLDYFSLFALFPAWGPELSRGTAFTYCFVLF